MDSRFAGFGLHFTVVLLLFLLPQAGRLHTRAFETAALEVWSSGQQPGEPRPDPEELPRIDPLEPQEALESFRIREGFRIELVAAEPLVTDPIALSFDEDGRMYVVEMRDYPEPEDREARLGRIRLLEDTTGDGRFDRSTVFADRLGWPTAVVCYDGGVFVGASPDILFLKDTTGNGRADLREVVFTGFGSEESRLNVQRLLNSFTWSLDNRIHGAKGHGGEIRSAKRPDEEPVNLHGRDFSFDPRTLRMRPESLGGQYGMSFDDWGRKFSTSNSDHLQMVVLEDRYAARNPYYSAPPGRISIAEDGPAAEVFRISPDEPWRIVRTRWRVAGLVPGPIEGGGRVSGYFTGATGGTIYRGDAWPADFRNNAFVADIGGNLIHRKLLFPDGVALTARRAPDEQDREFLASSDIWFRPTQLFNAPDGTLYVTDMYREVVEHPWSIPDSIKRHLDLSSGRDRGRIYRIVPEKFQPRELPRLSRATTAELVLLLSHPNGWHRDTAARLLYQKQDPAALPLLEELLNDPTSAPGRLHALYVLDGLGALGESHLLRRVTDGDPGVREHTVRLAERFLGTRLPDPRLWQAVHSRAEDPDIRVRHQVSLTLGELRPDFIPAERVELLWRIVKRDLEDRWIRVAALTSLRDGALEFFRVTAGEPRVRESEDGRELLGELAALLGARRRTGELRSFLEVFERVEQEDLALRLVRALAEGLERDGGALRDHPELQPLEAFFQRAARLAADRRTPLATRLRAVELLGRSPTAESALLLLSLLEPVEPPEVQSTALTSLGRARRPEVGPGILDRWPHLSPRLREEALAVLVARPENLGPLLDAMEEGFVLRSDFRASQLQMLRFHPDPELRDRAGRLLTDTGESTREEVVARFRPAVELQGRPERGAEIYHELCAACHRITGTGAALGPDMETVRDAGRESLLVHILDPNREIAPEYFSYLVQLADGAVVMGIVVNDEAQAITIREIGGNDRLIPRSQILEIRRLNQSIMPEGLESGLSPQDMADLLEFIVSTGN